MTSSNRILSLSGIPDDSPVERVAHAEIHDWDELENCSLARWIQLGGSVTMISVRRGYRFRRSNTHESDKERVRESAPQ